MKEVWDEGKTVAQNIKEMGLSLNPNKTLPLPKTKVFMYLLHSYNMYNVRSLQVVSHLQNTFENIIYF
jgi:hypothetical protein